MFKKQDILKVISDGYYLNPEMVKFLLIENLTLKTLLSEKGLFTAEEFQDCKNKVSEFFEEKAKTQMIQMAKTSVQ